MFVNPDIIALFISCNKNLSKLWIKLLDQLMILFGVML